MKYDFNVDMSTDNSLSLIIRNIKPNSNVLEFGPAKGYMTQYLKQQLNCNVYGIEIDEEAAELAKQFTEKMIICDIETLKWKDDIPIGLLFDHIVFADVLEHLREPAKVLKEAVSYLKPEGSVLTSIPNIGHAAVVMDLLQGKFEYRSLGLLDNTHVKFFTRESVQHLIEDAGLQPVDWKATYIYPEHTEFQQNYEKFPEGIRKYIQNRPDSHVYQFITISMLRNQALLNEHDNRDPQYIFSDFIQLFWKSNKNNYTESDSVKKPVFSHEKDFITYQFPIFGDRLVSPLRLDPTNFRGLVEIASIELKNDKNKRIEYLSGYQLNEKLEVEFDVIKLNCEQNYTIYSYGNDPQILIYLTTENQAKNPFILEISMRFSRDSEEILGKIMDTYLKNHDTISNIRDEVLKLEEKNTLLNNKVLELEGEKGKLLRLVTSLEQSIEKSNNTLEQLKIQEIRLKDQLKEVIKREDNTAEELNIVINSRSWKLTKPLRWLSSTIRGVLNRS